jgi:RHS repeat-associated protein
LQTLTAPAAISGGSFGFGYDALSRRTSLTRPNAVNTAYGYDNLSRLLSVTHAKGGTTLDGATYTVDNAGNRTAKSDLQAGVTTNYGYDAIYQLMSATQGGSTTESFNYDPVGNRLSSLGVASYSYNPSNELTSTSSTTYGYDNNGNATSKTDSTGTTNYNWDFENRLNSVTLPASGGTVNFKYDPFGRRIYKSSSSGTSVFAYDLDNLVEETNSSGAAVARYTQTENTDELLAMLRSSAASYYEQDGLGSVTSLSNAAGALAQTYAFDSFGKQTASSGSLTNPFQYAGRELDSETGLYYMRARYFDPQAGRFLSEDPIETDGNDLNFYRYVENNPVGFLDPTGLQRVNSPRTGQPNSTGRFPDPNNPGDVTVRVYGPNGDAQTDYDYGHDHTGAGDPHAHDWGKDKNGKPVRGRPRSIKPGEKVPPKECPPPPQATPKVPAPPLQPWRSRCIPGITCHLSEDGNYYPGAYPMLPPTVPAGPVPFRLPVPVPVPEMIPLPI